MRSLEIKPSGIPRILPLFLDIHPEESAFPLHINPRPEINGSNCSKFATESHSGPIAGRPITPGAFNVVDGPVFDAWSRRSIQDEAKESITRKLALTLGMTHGLLPSRMSPWTWRPKVGRLIAGIKSGIKSELRTLSSS